MSSLSSLSLLASVRQSEVRNIERNIVKQEIPNCINVNSFYDKVYCSSKVYSILDEYLNTAYKDARRGLNSTSRKSLQVVQRQWIRNRDDNCAKLEYDSIIVDLGCAKTATITSLYYLYEISESPQDFDLLIKEYSEER